MKYVVRHNGDTIEQEWCYYYDCDTCPDRFKCFTQNIIIDNCLHLKADDIIKQLEKRGIHIKRLVEY